jgi:phosphonate degradation associated HDIG domain protein
MGQHGADPIRSLRELFEARGALAYGEAVTQLEHALQCGAAAATDGAGDALVSAAFLHDVGHLLHADAAAALEHGRDDAHERLGAAWLARWFPPAVTEPIALHVEAKRYLCFAEPAYTAALSAVSIATLQIQGGAHDERSAQAFREREHAASAVRLRRWDEAAKLAGARTPSLEYFLACAARSIRG